MGSIARQKFCYLVVLNEKFLTPLASYLLLQIEQVLSEIGITMSHVIAKLLMPYSRFVIEQIDIRNGMSYGPVIFKGASSINMNCGVLCNTQGARRAQG
ncbi:hypothetical protein CWB99_07910 [Pseudoalteromonas rubra]|uniref:Uncharacterized protein n=1 Tax=Pseudoalteromonas rubra TaxID=43658 RepID=A0A5S3WN16_9GAMM|nr:hypothetical protein CWB99_07910 [Pseudoalteromonas rubra]TMP35121.1 hypothetical protein CWC00_04875 [Pseudoalteromonas rubra]